MRLKKRPIRWRQVKIAAKRMAPHYRRAHRALLVQARKEGLPYVERGPDVATIDGGAAGLFVMTKGQMFNVKLEALRYTFAEPERFRYEPEPQERPMRVFTGGISFRGLGILGGHYQ